jgi:hypothetical protein
MQHLEDEPRWQQAKWQQPSVSGTGSASTLPLTAEEATAAEARRKPIGFDPPAAEPDEPKIVTT